MLTEVRLRVLDREKALCHQLYDEAHYIAKYFPQINELIRRTIRS